jgi:hypothetical protein
MPMHDWTRVEPNDYHDFHGGWIFATRTWLNTGGLPPGYESMAEHTAPPVVPDVLALRLPTAREAPNGVPVSPGGVVATAPPPVRFTATGRLRARRRPARRRIAVRDSRDRHLVAVIEIVSPSNKANRAEFADLIDKAVLLLDHGIHLLVIDPFPPTARDKSGVHAAIWRAAVGGRFTPPADKPLTLAAYAAGPEVRAYVEPIAVGDPLPAMPLYLTPDVYVRVPLETTYQTAWAGYSPSLRSILEAPAPPA